MGVVRSTYAKCQAMKQILRTLMVKFEERDVFMSYAHQQDIRERMQNDDIEVPQLFVDGQYVGVSQSQLCVCVYRAKKRHITKSFLQLTCRGQLAANIFCNCF